MQAILSAREKVFSKPLKGVVAMSLGKDGPHKVREIGRIFISDGHEKVFSEFTAKEQKDYEEKIWKPTVFDEFIGWFSKLS